MNTFCVSVMVWKFFLHETWRSGHPHRTVKTHHKTVHKMKYSALQISLVSYLVFLMLCVDPETEHRTMDMIWEKFQWILPLCMKPISFQSKASVVCSVTAAIFIDFCLKKLNVFSQHIGQKTNEYLNSTEQILRNWNFDQLSMLITS